MINKYSILILVASSFSNPLGATCNKNDLGRVISTSGEKVGDLVNEAFQTTGDVAVLTGAAAVKGVKSIQKGYAALDNHFGISIGGVVIGLATPAAVTGMVLGIVSGGRYNQIQDELEASIPEHKKPEKIWSSFFIQTDKSSVPQEAYAKVYLTRVMGPAKAYGSGPFYSDELHVFTKQGQWPFRIKFEYYRLDVENAGWLSYGDAVHKGQFTLVYGSDYVAGTGKFLGDLSKMEFSLNKFSGLSEGSSFQLLRNEETGEFSDHPSSSELANSGNYKLLVMTLKEFGKKERLF